MESEMEVINISDKLAQIKDYWKPAIIGELNGQHIKLVKFKGEFIMHSHENEDEMFMVLKGSFRMVYPDMTLSLGEGDITIVPRGTPHKPVASEEVHALLFEPASTLNTGDVRNDFTVDSPEVI
jgi:mannose-6-phosphate isomerase-like protein (cupin superfamily)